MIVKNTWYTLKSGKWNEFYFSGRFYKTRRKLWEGFFLLGFIPLYIKCVKVEYGD